MAVEGRRTARRRRTAAPGGPPRAICYGRVSSEEQAASGAGLAAQRDALEREVLLRGWTDVLWIEDAGVSAKTLDRPGIRAALEALSAGDRDVLMVSKLDRLSRSLFDFAAVMEQSRREGWKVVALDVGVDTTSPQGEAMAGFLALFGQMEARLISDRTKAALATRRANGVRLGRPPELPDAVRAVISSDRATGMSFAAIARKLTRDGVKTARGGTQWHAGSVHAALQTLGYSISARAMTTTRVAGITGSTGILNETPSANE